jgi:hypothetical protein
MCSLKPPTRPEFANGPCLEPDESNQTPSPSCLKIILPSTPQVISINEAFQATITYILLIHFYFPNFFMSRPFYIFGLIVLTKLVKGNICEVHHYNLSSAGYCLFHGLKYFIGFFEAHGETTSSGTLAMHSP